MTRPPLALPPSGLPFLPMLPRRRPTTLRACGVFARRSLPVVPSSPLAVWAGCPSLLRSVRLWITGTNVVEWNSRRVTRSTVPRFEVQVVMITPGYALAPLTGTPEPANARENPGRSVLHSSDRSGIGADSASAASCRTGVIQYVVPHVPPLLRSFPILIVKHHEQQDVETDSFGRYSLMTGFRRLGSPLYSLSICGGFPYPSPRRSPDRKTLSPSRHWTRFPSFPESARTAALSPFHNVRAVAHEFKFEWPFEVPHALFDRERGGQLPSVLAPAAAPLEPPPVLEPADPLRPSRLPVTLAISTKASSHFILPTIPNIKPLYNNSRQQESKKRIAIDLGASRGRKIERHGKNEGRWHKIVYEKDPTERYCTSCSKQGYSKSNFKLRSKKSSTTDAANKEKSKQQPSAPNSNAYRKKSSQGQRGKAPPRQVYRPTGKTVQSSFENTYNLPKKTADNQTEQNLFLLINNKKTSQHIQISADPSTSTASHDSQLRVDSSHQVIVDAIDSSLAANNSNVDNSSPAIEETSNHSRHEAPEKAWRTSFVESSIGPNAYHMGDRPVRQRTMLDFSINFLISRLTDIYLIGFTLKLRKGISDRKEVKRKRSGAIEFGLVLGCVHTLAGIVATDDNVIEDQPRSAILGVSLLHTDNQEVEVVLSDNESSQKVTPDADSTADLALDDPLAVVEKGKVSDGVKHVVHKLSGHCDPPVENLNAKHK
ncbi:hypothetical protein Tco_0431175 [Tanacetum coccineum]